MTPRALHYKEQRASRVGGPLTVLTKRLGTLRKRIGSSVYAGYLTSSIFFVAVNSLPIFTV